MSVLTHSINIGVTAFEKAQILFWLTGIFIDTDCLFKSGFSSQERNKQRESWKAQQKKHLHLYPIMNLTST